MLSTGCCGEVQAEKIVCSTSDMQIQMDGARARILKCHAKVGGNLDDLEVFSHNFQHNLPLLTVSVLRLSRT